MQTLIQMYGYYEDMMKQYESEEKTEYNVTKRNQFRNLLNAVAREIEVMAEM